MAEDLKTAIENEMPRKCYEDLYRKHITERLKSNEAYNETHNMFQTIAKEFRLMLKVIDEHPETASEFPDKADVFTKIMELMRKIADYECAELMCVVREEEKTGNYLIKNGGEE